VTVARAIGVGDVVRYCDGVYEVRAVNDDLLTLAGVAVLVDRGFGICREACTVLASDVVLIAEQSRLLGDEASRP
jgi:hypothetical protein